MGTRADFYVGRGKKAKYLGSIAWDGYSFHEKFLAGKKESIMDSKDEVEFQSNVEKMIKNRDDGTLAKDGFPFPWNDSRTTDYAYCFDKGKVWVYLFGSLNGKGKQRSFPDMRKMHNVQFGDKSGLIIISTNKTIV